MSADQLAAEVRDLLAVVISLLSPPFAATYEGHVTRHELILDRAAAVAGALSPVADGDCRPRSAMHLRALLDEPLPYEPEGGES